MSEHSADRGTTSERLERLERWRAEAIRLGGMPQSHPNVPSEYVYMANRTVHVIDDLIRTIAWGTSPAECNCGWGGVHDPDNTRCAWNDAVLPPGVDQ